MISYKVGTVFSIVKKYKDISFVEVEIDDVIYNAVNYNVFTGKISLKDKVVLNTSAVELGLGTGGYHYVMYNYNIESMGLKGSGHIMKLRYTPYQISCLVAEEENSPYHNIIKNFQSLDDHLCVSATLHSMVAPISAMIKYLSNDIKINYIMTDGGALPIAFSKTIAELKSKKIIENTITIGHAFGGDLECVNIYTGLITSKELLKGDITIISMGPGVVGTGTKYGFTGIEQGYIMDGINSLSGHSIAVPRISFQDKRSRHFGISHHTITVLSKITNTRSNLILPILHKDKNQYIIEQIEKFEINDKHNIVFQKGDEIEEAMSHYDLNIKSMGRSIKEDKEYFTSLGAVGRYVVNYLGKEDKDDF